MTSYRHQRGAVLLALVVGFSITAGSALLLVNSASRDGIGHSAVMSGRSTALELQKAKRALMAYAVSYADNYSASGAGVGHFPCPDRDPINDGVVTNDGPDPPCSTTGTTVGRMPRYTFVRDAESSGSRQKLIEFYPLRSLLDQQMWYVVSRSFVNNPVSTIVNPATRADLNVDGVDNVVAVIVAPGPELSVAGQRRPSDAITDYLEGENADGDLTFSRLRIRDGNDQLVYITTDELLPLILHRVTRFAVDWLEGYRLRHCGRIDHPCYPAALLLDDIFEGVAPERHWFSRNKWEQFIDYTYDPVCLLEPPAACVVEVEPAISGENYLRRIVVKPRVFVQ